jgi:hypothetical protein
MLYSMFDVFKPVAGQDRQTVKSRAMSST